MTAGPEQHPAGQDSPRRRPRRGAWLLLAAGVILGIAAVTCLAAGAVSAQQGMAMGLPAVLLIIIGLLVAVAPDPADVERFGYRAGTLTGAAFGRLRGAFRRCGSRF